MASRKKTVSLSLGLSLPPVASVVAPTVPAAVRHEPEADSDRVELDLDELDDYDEERTHNDVPRFRLVDPPTAILTIEVNGVGFDKYEVARLGREGISWARVIFTRAELVELIERANTALRSDDGNQRE